MPRKPPSTIGQIAAALDLADMEVTTLRAMARRDPPRGCPMIIGEHEIEPGAWRGLHADPVHGLPLNSPIQPLGKDGSNYYFLDTLGAVYIMQARGSGKGEIDSLFAGRPLFLEWAWPRWLASRKKDEPPTVKGFEADESRRDLFAACAYKGTFELEDRVRGRGAWRDDDGSLIYHAGDAVWLGGKWRRPGEIGRWIYPARMRLGRPADLYEPEGPGSPGDAVLELLRTWNWERGELDARLMLGWMMTAKIGGALDERPVVYLSGEEGAGKSSLQKLLRALMNGALMATSNTTQAGIYQRVKQDSVAVLVDESTEAKEDMRGSDKLLELARIAYSGDKMNRGDRDGVGREFALMSSFIASSIVVPSMDAQDASRMALLVVRTLSEATADLDLDAKVIDTWGRQLLRRLFDWYPRWAELRRRFRAALIAVGHDSRSADTFGPLAAGAHVALHDDWPSPETIAMWQAWLKADQLQETSGKQKTWKRCFDLMLQAQPDILKTGHHKSVGSALLDYRDTSEAPEKINNVLRLVGLSLGWSHGAIEGSWDAARLFVPANHPGLHDLFKGTAWAGRLGTTGPWAAVLRQAPRDLWENGKSEKGLDRKASGVFIRLAAMLEA